MFEQSITGFIKNLAALRDFVALIAQFLEQHGMETLKTHFEAFKEIVSIASEQIPADKRKSAGGIHIGVDPQYPTKYHLITTPLEGEKPYELFIEHPSAQSFSEIPAMLEKLQSRQKFLSQMPLLVS